MSSTHMTKTTGTTMHCDWYGYFDINAHFVSPSISSEPGSFVLRTQCRRAKIIACYPDTSLVETETPHKTDRRGTQRNLKRSHSKPVTFEPKTLPETQNVEQTIVIFCQQWVLNRCREILACSALLNCCDLATLEYV